MIFNTGAFAEKITWITIDWPPFEYRENGEFKGYGIEWMKMLQAELPEYQHEFRQANTARLMQSLKQGEKVCSLGFYKSATRDKFVHYSIPDVLWFPVQLFMRKETFIELGKPNLLSLQDLIDRKLGYLGVVHGTSYTKDIDNILSSHKDNPLININYTGTMTKNLFAMMLIKRIDFVIDFPPEGKHSAELAQGRNRVVSVPIAEAQALGVSHTICPKTPWGEKTITAINRALTKLKQQQEWRGHYEAVLDEHLIPLYRAQYQQIMLP